MSNPPVGVPGRTVCELHGKRFCWASGMQAKPSWWNAPWYLQAAHLGAGSGVMHRVDDIRMVVCLCPLLHELHVDDRVRLPQKTICSNVFPTIDNANMLWIKQTFDAEHWNSEFVEQCWNGTPPQPEKLDAFWINKIENNQGIVL